MRQEYHGDGDGIGYKRLYNWNSLTASVWLPSLSELVGYTGTAHPTSGVHASAMQGLNVSVNYWTDMQGGEQWTYFKQFNASGGGEKIWNACEQEKTWLRSPDYGQKHSVMTYGDANGIHSNQPATNSHAVHPAVGYKTFDLPLLLGYTSFTVLNNEKVVAAVEVRPLTGQDDRLAVSRVYEESWKAAYCGIIPQAYLDSIPAGKWAAHLDTSGWRSLILLDQEEIVGTCAFSSARHTDMQGYGELISLYLLPAYWGHGYGRLLLDGAIQALYTKGFDKTYLWVLEENRRARQFYEKHGFQQSGAVLTDNIGGKPLREVQYIYNVCARTKQEESP